MKKVFLQTEQMLTLEELAELISNTVEHDDVAKFIAILEKNYESWDVTIDLIRHFKSLEITYINEVQNDVSDDETPFREIDDADLSPQSLI